MALSAEAAAVNAAVDAVLAAMEAYIESISTGDYIYITPLVAGGKNPRGADQDSAVKFDVKLAQKLQWGLPVANEAAIPLTLRGKPLFFKLTNAAGDTS